jgi:PII-like signaling protein
VPTQLRPPATCIQLSEVLQSHVHWVGRGAALVQEEEKMTSGKAVKVIFYLSDGAKHHGVPVYASLLDFLFHSSVAGATVTKGVAGFGAKHRLHAAHILDLSDHLPIKVEFIETREKVDALMPELEKRCGGGLIEVNETNIIVPTRD